MVVSTLGLALWATSSCTAEHQPAVTKTECKPNQFRACDTDACHGVQQCVAPGYWGDCDCVLGDAGYADASDDETATDSAADDAEGDVTTDGAADADADAD